MPLDTEGSLRKLMEIEYRNINAGMVTRGRKLKDQCPDGLGVRGECHQRVTSANNRGARMAPAAV